MSLPEIPGIDLAVVLQSFFAEARERLQDFEEAALVLEARPGDAEALAEIFRAVHTVKGNAASLGFDGLAASCHELETALDTLRQARRAVTGEEIDALLGAVDELRGQLDRAEHGHRGNGRGRSGAGRTLRVGLGKLDRLLHLAGEIAVAHGRLTGAVERGGGLDRTELLEVHGALDPLFGQLQERVTELRMVPVGPLFRQQGRAVHDLAAAEGKQVRLTLEGEEVEVDAAVIEQLGAPLTHLIRNAIAHGIETPAERRRAGKDPCGEITLRASHSAGQMVIEVRDDGAGLDRARIEARARELGRGDASELPDADLFQLLFEPGFSTAAAVTGVSGRGVGLDVVRRHAEALRGTVALDGRPGRGAVFTLRIPLTLAIIEGLTVEAGGETFVLPLDRVVECVDLTAADAERARPAGLFHLRGTPLPYLRLRELFALGGTAPRRENLVVVEGEGGLAGVAVDGLRGKSQTVIQPLGPLFRGIQGISGTAALGSGRLALILDVPALLRDAARRPAAGANAPS